MWWKKAPFVRILIGFVAGILLADQRLLSFPLLCMTIALAVLLWLCYSCLSEFYRHKFSWLSSLLVQLIFFSFGAFRCLEQEIDVVPSPSGNQAFLLKVLEKPVQKSSYYRARGSLFSCDPDKKDIMAIGEILLYFKNGMEIPTEGSWIRIEKNVEPIRNNGNPGEFDLKTYWKRQHIGYSVYLVPRDIKQIIPQPVGTLKKWLQGCQHYILTTMTRAIPSVKERGLAEALLIGYREDLDKELSSSYAITGTVHIIAISGMHLSLIYALLFSLFRVLPEKRGLKWIKVFSLLTVLWLFSLLCGGQPSLLRATISFSFLLLAHAFNRRSNTVNALAGSAFILLCIDPYYLWDPGFQLSYAALSGILLFNNRFRRLFQTENKFLKYVYDLFAVTLSAQLLTFPLSIYHFHQFPVYFLFSNLLAVPLSGIILFLEIGLLVVSPWPILTEWTGKLTTLLIRTMNDWIERTSELPFSSIQEIRINPWQLWLLYFALLCLGIFLAQRKYHWLWAFISSLVLIQFIGLYRTYSQKNASRFIVYAIKNGSQAEYQSGGNAWAFFPDTRESMTIQQQAHSALQIGKTYPSTGHDRYFFAGKQLMIREEFQDDAEKLPDWLLLCGKAMFSVRSPSLYTNTLVIIDRSVPYSYAQKIERLCDSLHIAFHSVRDKGAYIAEF